MPHHTATDARPDGNKFAGKSKRRFQREERCFVGQRCSWKQEPPTCPQCLLAQAEDPGIDRGLQSYPAAARKKSRCTRRRCIRGNSAGSMLGGAAPSLSSRVWTWRLAVREIECLRRDCDYDMRRKTPAGAPRW